MWKPGGGGRKTVRSPRDCSPAFHCKNSNELTDRQIAVTVAGPLGAAAREVTIERRALLDAPGLGNQRPPGSSNRPPEVRAAQGALRRGEQPEIDASLEALIAAEAGGVLHRDLKPTNVLVNWLPSKKFQVKILDFSLAKFSSTPAPQTIDQGDAIFGSIYFMAPEQFERGNLDKRTDLSSMGCLYYYCLTGQYPFQGDSAAQVMASHLQGTVIPLEQIRADLPPVICQWGGLAYQ